jgi:hypothetical protein
VSKHFYKKSTNDNKKKFSIYFDHVFRGFSARGVRKHHGLYGQGRALGVPVGIAFGSNGCDAI